MKTDIILNMKLLMAMVFFPMAAVAVTVTPLPPSEFADTEVSTNIVFVVERPAMTRIEFTVALDATPTNNVEVAIGTDANGDGNLAVEETAYVFGYDCGTWFCRDRDANKTEEAIAKPCRGCISAKCTSEGTGESASFCAFHGNAPTGNRGFAIASESSAVDLNLRLIPVF